MNSIPPIQNCAEIPPPEFHVVRLFLPDGTHCAGFWTGRVYWCWGAEVHPERWQEIDDKSLVADTR